MKTCVNGCIVRASWTRTVFPHRTVMLRLEGSLGNSSLRVQCILQCSRHLEGHRVGGVSHSTLPSSVAHWKPSLNTVVSAMMAMTKPYYGEEKKSTHRNSWGLDTPSFTRVRDGHLGKLSGSRSGMPYNGTAPARRFPSMLQQPRGPLQPPCKPF